jgi:hypothetical protein
VVGDFDANGYDDVIFVNPVGASVMRRHRQGGQTDTGLALPRGFTVRAGDFTGERRADLVMYRRNRNNGDVQAWLTNAGGTTFRKTSYQVQPAAFQPVVADFSGDFKSDIVWYQPGTAIDVFWKGFAPTAPYFARETANLGMTGNWVPVAGDFNGDGTADIFFYGPGNASDRVWRSNQTAWLAQKVSVIP